MSYEAAITWSRGQGRAIEVEVTLTPEPPEPPELTTDFGALSTPTELEPGRYAATLTPPDNQTGAFTISAFVGQSDAPTGRQPRGAQLPGGPRAVGRARARPWAGEHAGLGGLERTTSNRYRNTVALGYEGNPAWSGEGMWFDTENNSGGPIDLYFVPVAGALPEAQLGPSV